MKNKLLLILLFIVTLMSCRPHKTNIDLGLYTEYVKLSRYEIVDSLTIDSMINVAKREHKRITGYTASFFEIFQGKDGYNVSACSTFDGMDQGEEIEWQYVFSYYKGMILLIHRKNIPKNLFRPSGESAYVMLISGGGDLTNCEFDSKFQFIKSKSAIVEIK